MPKHRHGRDELRGAIKNPKLTIAIDGPSGTGKVVCDKVARHFGLAYLDHRCDVPRRNRVLGSALT